MDLIYCIKGVNNKSDCGFETEGFEKILRGQMMGFIKLRRLRVFWNSEYK